MQTVDIPAIERELNKNVAPTTLTVNVTRRDIWDADMQSIKECAVGRALERACREAFGETYAESWAGNDRVSICRVAGKYPFTGHPIIDMKHYMVPTMVRNKISTLIGVSLLFGRLGRLFVKPFSFTITL